MIATVIRYVLIIYTILQVKIRGEKILNKTDIIYSFKKLLRLLVFLKIPWGLEVTTNPSKFKKC